MNSTPAFRSALPCVHQSSHRRATSGCRAPLSMKVARGRTQPRFNKTETAGSDESTEPTPAERELIQEQLGAFYESAESMYQTRLASAFELGVNNFRSELKELWLAVRQLAGKEPPDEYIPPKCLGLTLQNGKIAEREKAREEMYGLGDASPFVVAVYKTVCFFLDVTFDGRPIQRFWVLETVARLPYQAYTSCLHLLSTLGWYRSPALMNMHHAEDLNEAYHLSVMEALGGDKGWFDRFTAFHSSLIYYWILVALFLISPAQSYAFSRLLEGHAVDTYGQFLDENEALLKELPAPEVSYTYYREFIFYFHEFQLTKHESTAKPPPRPKISSLYDVFSNILADEQEHTSAMVSCQEYVTEGKTIRYNDKVVSGKARDAVALKMKNRIEFWRKWKELHRAQQQEK